MMPDDFRSIRAQLGWTWKRTAAELGVHWRTVARWERGERPISPLTARAIRTLIPDAFFVTTSSSSQDVQWLPDATQDKERDE